VARRTAASRITLQQHKIDIARTGDEGTMTTITTSYSEPPDSTHANHVVLDPSSGSATFSGTFSNYVDPVFGPTTDVDFFEVDFGNLDPNGTLTITFTPQDPNAYYYRILARLDTAANLAGDQPVLGENSTWIVRDPANGQHIHDTTNSNSDTISDLESGGANAIEFHMDGGDSNSGGFYTPLAYSVTVTYTPPGGNGNLPDLTVSDAAAIPSRAVTAGSDILVRYTLNNVGTGNAVNPSHGIFLSTDATLDSSDVELESRTHTTTITPGGQYSTSSDVILPANLAPGTYYLIVDANPDNQIQESNESNNTEAIPIIVGGALPRYDGHSYGFVNFNGTAQTWSQARTEAAAMGGYLATITSQGENNFIENNVLAGNLTQPGAAAFIGASDAAQEGVWQWVTGPETGTTFWNGEANGTVVPGQYANWATGEPNNATNNPDGSEDYAVIGSDGRWVDVPSIRAAGATAGFVVEFSNRAFNDFNGDANSDALWRNTSTGEVDTWLLTNGQMTGGTGVGSVSSAWQTLATGDFNGDGTSDILWRNSNTGEIDTWLINNGHISGGTAISSVSSAWQFAGVGDFNGDGTSDALWRNRNTGEVDTWLLNNGHIVGGTAIGSVSSAWQPATVGDFNGDGTSDVLWRNTNTGEVDTWLLNGGHVTGGSAIGSASSAWQCLGAGDFNGDGTSDLLWRNINTGEVDTWLMTSGHVTGGIAIGSVSSAWQFAGIGDLNGDGSSDVLWRNTNTGEVDTWLMTNGHVTGGTAIGHVSTAWQTPTLAAG
jgi:hypothetical protein